MKDYYSILNVDRKATEDEIKKAHRSLVMQYHPDRAPDDKKNEYAQKFSDISEAYDVLGDKEKRAKYDNPVSSTTPFYDFFRPQNFATKGEPIHVYVEVKVNELFQNVDKKVEVVRKDICDLCNGSKIQKDKTPITCDECHGQGFAEKVIRKAGFTMVSRDKCHNCEGLGNVVDEKDFCSKCCGFGNLVTPFTFTVTVPKGCPALVPRIVVYNEAHIGSNGGPRGDIIIIIRHPADEYQRLLDKQENFVYTVKIPYWKAVLGGDVNIPHIQKPITLKVPNMAENDTIRLDKMGLPVYGSSNSFGDMFVKFAIDIPSNIHNDELSLIQKMKEIYEKENN